MLALVTLIYYFPVTSSLEFLFLLTPRSCSNVCDGHVPVPIYVMFMFYISHAVLVPTYVMFLFLSRLFWFLVSVDECMEVSPSEPEPESELASGG